MLSKETQAIIWANAFSICSVTISQSEPNCEAENNGIRSRKFANVILEETLNKFG